MPDADRSEGKSPVDWAEVRRAYEVTGLPAAELRRRFGLTKGQLRWRRERERWLRPAARDGAAVTRLGSASPRRLRVRLLQLLDLSVAELELNAARGSGDYPDAAGVLAALGGAWAHLADTGARGSAMNGSGLRDGRGAGGAGHSGRGNRHETGGAAHNKKNTHEPGSRAGQPGDLAADDQLDRLRAELKSRLERLREPR